ncbi:amidase signature domain-containing protein [Microdochium trichocladiopsis]|uniref:Amidase signature domain-containing protein n=1 Tax=Microdochium trichocladiopsis TaxID=1682393 RepID=A0A9P9BLY6_9PEZI|nr:amidase signature domain-containing protein [Microdochium trichocladiopsis]KAH7029078.1 amidase signature domain-containing protein [Microdochium trichocladiopsis]
MTPMGMTMAIDDVPYHVPVEPVGKLSSCAGLQGIPGSYDLTPITIFDVHQANCSVETLSQFVADYLEKDDVFNEGFLQGVYFRNNDVNVTIPDIAAHPNITCIKAITTAMLDIPAGPYVLSQSTGEVYMPYRLYSDTMGAFHQGVIAAADGQHWIPLHSAVAGSSAVTVGVPSRLYHKPTADKPLAGVRLGVKDLYNIKGIKTGLGSRAYYAVYPEANTTAVPVQRLVDAGAIVIGKMKLSQFAAPENARDAIDYLMPFNPRGDGYQEVTSSSSGPAGGMASYDWLDLALASDTGGSIRIPAEFNGLFGNRPSYDTVPLTDGVPLGPQFDTAGFLVRDPKLWHAASKVMYSGLATGYTKLPSKIVTYELPTTDTPDLTDAQKLVVQFVDKVSNHLSATISTYNLSKHWAETRPSGTPENNNDLLNITWPILAAQEQIRGIRDPLFKAYAAKYDSRTPFVNDWTNASWHWASQFPDLIDEAANNKTIFMDWWNTVALPNNTDSCSESVFLYVFNAAQPTYRTALPQGSSGIPLGLNTMFISPMAGNPDFVVPIGQVKYYSSISQHEEVLPVSVRLMAARGCDLMLLDLINELVDAGIVPQVKTGTSVLEGGDIYV